MRVTTVPAVTVFVMMTVSDAILALARLVAAMSMSVMRGFWRRPSQDEAAESFDKEAEPNRKDNCSRDDAENRKQLLRQDVLRREERHNAERKDTRRVSNGDCQSEKGSMLEGPSRSHEIGPDNGFAVPW